MTGVRREIPLSAWKKFDDTSLTTQLNKPAMKTRFSAPNFSYRSELRAAALLLLATATSALAGTIALPESDWQPFTAQIKRLTDALEYLGSPLESKTQAS